MLVSEWMTPDPVTVTSDTPIMAAMNLQRKHGFRRLPVVDHHKLVGVVSDRDLRDASASQATTLSVYELNYLLSKLLVKEVMTRSVLSVKPEDPIERAATLMETHKISGLPVMDGDSLVGILSITDLLKAFVEILGLRKGGRLRETASA